MSLAEQICLVAQKPEYATLLAAKSIAAIFVTTLKDDVAAARTLSTTAVNCTTASAGETRKEDNAERVLVRRLRSAQAAARLTYADSQPERLDDYLIGQRINQSRPVLEQSAQTIMTTAEADRPGGIDTEFVDLGQAERTAYVQSNVPQVAEEAAAKAARAQRDAQVDSINQRRRKIQFAADLAWPAGVPANEKARKEFRLPASRPFAV